MDLSSTSPFWIVAYNDLPQPFLDHSSRPNWNSSTINNADQRVQRENLWHTPVSSGLSLLKSQGNLLHPLHHKVNTLHAQHNRRWDSHNKSLHTGHTLPLCRGI